MISPPICPYCGLESILVKGSRIYPFYDRLKDLNFWLCQDCDAYVGCHRESEIPLGTLADSHLRGWRQSAHKSFDIYWRKGPDQKFRSRPKAYNFLASKMNLPKENCHIGMFDVDQCEKVIQICNNVISKLPSRRLF